MLLTAATLLAAMQLFAQTTLTAVPTKDRKIVKRWALPGDPRGVAIGADGTVYAGLAEPQAVVAINPATGAVKQRVVLDSAEIASTKELVTLRTNADRTRLFIANGSDESASILSLPNLAVLREITTEGETIRDVLPDPQGRYVYLLGRRVHVYDGNAEKELRTVGASDPMAIAVSANGKYLAIVATEDFGNAKATSVALYETASFAEVARDPLQTTETIEAAMFANGDRALVALSREHLYEKPLVSRPAPSMERQNGETRVMRMRIDFGDLVNSDRVCLPVGSGPQIAAFAGNDTNLVYAERRCDASGAFFGSQRAVTPASLYGVSAYAIAFDKTKSTLVATDRAGFLTIYNLPHPALAH
ncbi:MAG: hypothetical protein JO197_23850 [Acidobacteria bacterium]|nr:hypothetical protein [Acidobacteriota bacterium]MBV9476936.1 hypothetical protein [Acidobacteriota bacterium]